MSSFSGSLSNIFIQLKGAIESCIGVTAGKGSVQIANACSSPLPDETASVWFTDPPYYDSVPYSDLSDYFYVWLKRALEGHPLTKDPFDPENLLTPKLHECVWNRGHMVDGKPKDVDFFENSMRQAFSEGRRVLQSSEVGCVVFAHKTTEGWEAFLSGIINGGFVITASWPILTERTRRLLAINTAALATSVHLVCRPRDRRMLLLVTGAMFCENFRVVLVTGWNGCNRKESEALI